MGGGYWRNGGRRAYQILFHRSPRGADLSKPSPPRPRAYTRTHLFSSKLRDSSTQVSPASPSLFSSSASASTTSSTSSQNGFVSWYLGMIEARPVLTKSLTAGVIFTAADISSQMITETSSDSLDIARTLRMASYGLLFSGPTLNFWFNFVSRILPKRDLVTTFKKMFLGQATYGPIMTVVFFSYNASLQGETIDEIIARLKRDLIPTFISGLAYWPMCDFITFKFIPVRLQPLVSNSFSFLWTIYITYMASLQKVNVEKISD